jgi:hypothetical protein
MKQTLNGITLAATLFGLVLTGCGSSTTSAYDGYVYYGYYPADVYYSGYSWTDPYSVYYYAVAGANLDTITGGDGGTTDGGDAGSTSDGGTGRHSTQTVGDVIRSLAAGQTVCPGSEVTITRKTAPGVCDSNASSMVNNGVTIVFNGCQLSNGGRLDGTYDVAATRTASDASCTGTTMITVSVTTTITNLTYLGPGGRKLNIPSETGTSTFSYVNGQAPIPSAFMIQGRMQVINTNGSTLADQSFSGNVMVTPSQDRSSYALDGALMLQDQTAASTTTLTAAGLSRTSDCCRPTGGSLQIAVTGGANAGTHTYTFGPSCGAAKLDGNSTSLPSTCL